MSGINFRATSGYATDGAGETYSLGEAYPTTRGSQTFGWGSSRTSNSRDRASTNAHTSGIVFIANGGSTDTFTVDLPSTGTYDVRLAIGDATNGQSHKIVVKDDTTTLATITGSTGAGQWLDATGTLRTTYLLWESDNVALSLTFATTKLVLTVGDPSGSAATTISHVSYTSAGDTTAPTLTSPTGTSTGSTTATVGATTDEGNGTLYAVVTTSGTAPTKAQVKAGQNAGGTSANWSGSVAVSSTGAKTLNATGLTASTAHYAHLMHEDAAANQSTVVSSASFTTSAGSSAKAGVLYFYQPRNCNV